MTVFLVLDGLVLVGFWFLGNRWGVRCCSGYPPAFAQRLLTGKIGPAGEWPRPSRSGPSTDGCGSRNCDCLVIRRDVRCRCLATGERRARLLCELVRDTVTAIRARRPT